MRVFDVVTFNDKKVLSNNKGQITSLSYSPDGKLLASADSSRCIIVYDTENWGVKINQWVYHTAKINDITWSPDSLHAASGALDTNVEVWSVQKPTKHICIKGLLKPRVSINVTHIYK